MSTDYPEIIETEEAFHRVYQDLRKDFCRYAEIQFKAHGSQHVSVSGRAEEAVQEMFATAWELRDKMNEKGRPIGWMYECLYYKVQELLREDRQWTKRIMQMSEYCGSDKAGDFRLKVEMEGIISPEDYQLLKKKHLHGYTYAELCEDHGLEDRKKSTMAMRLKRIKERYIEKYGQD